MINKRQLFFNFLGQTSSNPLSIEIAKAEDCILYDNNGKEYIDLISGISVSNVGHRHPEVIKAIHKQLDEYCHVMVYGELILSPQVELAEFITKLLPSFLSNVYFVSSGSEANEGAIKAAKKYTNRYQTISFKNAYHGSTQGSLSLMGNNDFKDPFMPLIPGNHVINFNDIKEFEKINESIACVIIEPVQGEAGIIPADKEFLKGLRKKCNETGTLLIFDEVQTGFGRTGSMFAFEDYEVVPDIITLAKAMGGGMPIGAFISSKEIMSTLSKNPELGHITTFGGHPVSCAASLASLQVLIKENLVKQVKDKEFAFIERLKRIPYVKKYRSKGLMIAIEFESFDITREIVKTGLENGILVDWFLFAPQCIRLAPPLTISFKLIEEAMDKFETTLNQVFN